MSDLESIIKSGRETRSLDYKAATKWDEGQKKACCELVKDILAFANTDGGFIVIGVSEVAHGFQFDGLSLQQLASFDTTRLNRFVQNYAEPPINCTIAKPEVNGRHYVVIQVPAFPDTPHICQKDYPGALTTSTLYIRTANNESAPIKSSADFRKLVERGVRHRQDHLLESFRAILVGANSEVARVPDRELFLQELASVQKRGALATRYPDEYGDEKYKGFREAWAFPARFEAERFTLSTLRGAAQEASSEYRGWPFLYFSKNGENMPTAVGGGLEASVQFRDFANQDRADYWYWGHSGLFFQRTLMWEESFGSQSKPQVAVLAVKELAAYAIEALKCICTLAGVGLPPDEVITVGICVRGAAGRQAVNVGPGAMPLFDSYVAAIDVITYERSRTLADWQAGAIDYAVEAWAYILERFNWTVPNVNSARQTIERLLARQLG